MREIDDKDLDNVAGGGSLESHRPSDGLGGGLVEGGPGLSIDNNPASGSNTGDAETEDGGTSGGSSNIT